MPKRACKPATQLSFGVRLEKIMKIYWLASVVLAFFVLSAPNAIGSEDAIDTYSTDHNYAQVKFVEAEQYGDGSWCISTTVRHNDEGWDHYANAWQVLDEEGNELGWRMLAHPHDDEQPFTREQCDIEIPEKIIRIIVRAKCKVHGFGGQPVLVDLSKSDGEKFKVTRKKK